MTNFKLLNSKLCEHNNLKRRILMIFLVIFIFGAGYCVGNSLQRLTEPTEPEKIAVEMPCNIDKEKPQDVESRDFGIFWETWKTLKTNYFKHDSLTTKQLIYGAAEGLVGATGDPYSMFLKPDDAKKFEEDISGNFGGIGIEIGIKKKILTVISPLAGSPAEKAGFKAGDQIVKINSTSTYNLSIDEAVKLIRGKPGTEVNLTIYRDGWENTKEFKIQRDTIVVPSLKLEMIDLDGRKVAYLRLFNFNENSDSDFYKAAIETLLKQPDGLILDLRNNPGGYLEISVDIAGWFIKEPNIIVKQVASGIEDKIFRSKNKALLGDIPMVILVNQGSASAAEILAGALRDDKGTMLIGEKTFGKGSVQTIKTLSDGSVLKFTIANWLTPKDHLIEEQGLDPDVKVEITDEDVKSGNDPQLTKAKEVLKNEIIKQEKESDNWRLKLPDLQFNIIQ